MQNQRQEPIYKVRTYLVFEWNLVQLLMPTQMLSRPEPFPAPSMRTLERLFLLWLMRPRVGGKV
jgi:hypothetical protein